MLKKVLFLLAMIVIANYANSCDDGSTGSRDISSLTPYIYDLEPDSLEPGKKAVLFIINPDSIDYDNDHVELNGFRVDLYRQSESECWFKIPYIKEDGYLKIVGWDYQSNEVPFFFKEDMTSQYLNNFKSIRIIRDFTGFKMSDTLLIEGLVRDDSRMSNDNFDIVFTDSYTNIRISPRNEDRIITMTNPSNEHCRDYQDTSYYNSDNMYAEIENSSPNSIIYSKLGNFGSMDQVKIRYDAIIDENGKVNCVRNTTINFLNMIGSIRIEFLN